MPYHRFSHDPGFLGIRPRISAIVVRIGQMVEFQAHAGNGVVGAGYDEQPIVVELLVRNRDQRLMLTAVVPVEHPMREPLRQAQIEDAFGILRLEGNLVIFVSIIFVARQLREEAGGW